MLDKRMSILATPIRQEEEAKTITLVVVAEVEEMVHLMVHLTFKVFKVKDNIVSLKGNTISFLLKVLPPD